jgi:hypothetical protein
MDTLHDHDPALLDGAAPETMARATAAQVREWMATVTLRLAGPGDGPAVAHLAALEEAPAPQAPLLLAERDGRAVAARSLVDGRAVSDPFARSSRLLELLALHAGAAARRGRGRERWRRGRS